MERPLRYVGTLQCHYRINCEAGGGRNTEETVAEQARDDGVLAGRETSKRQNQQDLVAEWLWELGKLGTAPRSLVAGR